MAITEDTNATEGASVSTYRNGPTGCHGKADTSIPGNAKYYLTSFGGPGDHQQMSCGGYATGTGYYAASRQRYGCGAKLQIQANGKCVVVSALDYGPDVCVENAAGGPIIDASPTVSKYLFGSSSAGWSDHFAIEVRQVGTTTPVGPCEDSNTPPPPAGTSTEGQGDTGGGASTTSGASCASATLGRDVDDGTCVQAASDGAWYACDNGVWDDIADSSSCTGEVYGYCDSATLGYEVPARTCVQSRSSGIWYQCNGSVWVSPVSTSSRTGALGACSTWNPL